MTDRELLEAAAKAAGMPHHVWAPALGSLLYVEDGGKGSKWNPLQDDGDALRLAVKLEIRSEPSPRGCSVFWPTRNGQLRIETVLNHVVGKDSYASTRLAIVRAAAAIGGAQP